MFSRFRTILSTFVLFAVAFAANEMSDMVGAQAAMACCAKTDYSCAGLSAPDTCCQHMHHAASHSTPSTAAGAQSIDSPPAIVSLPSALAVRSAAWDLAQAEFKRPHDPPYLHTYSLLI